MMTYLNPTIALQEMEKLFKADIFPLNIDTLNIAKEVYHLDKFSKKDRMLLNHAIESAKSSDDDASAVFSRAYL
jgi:hypothetical protein